MEHRLVTSLLAVLATSHHPFCHADVPLSEGDFLHELPIVLSGSRLAQPVMDAPAAITVIDRQMIEASGLREIPELLRLVPGFQVGSANGHVHTATYHGLSDRFSRRMQVLVDGRSVYSPAIGGVEWTEQPIAMDDIERIEVIRGPNAATHGANAFLGVISIITRDPAETPGTHLKLSHGQGGIEDALLRHGDRLGDLDYRLSVGLRSDDGFDHRHDDKRLRLATLRASYQAGMHDMLEVQLGYSDGPRQEGYFDDMFWQANTTDRHSQYQLFHWQHAQTSDNEFNLRLYHNQEKRDETRTGKMFFPVDGSGTMDRYDLEFYQTLRTGPRLRLVWGASIRRDSVSGPLFYGHSKALHSNLNRLFTNLEWQPLPELTLNIGALREHNDITGTDLSPRLAAAWRFSPHQSLRASLSKALRTPVLFEEHADMRVQLSIPPLPEVQLFTSSGDLKPESILSRELGYVAEFRRWNTSLDVKLYHDSLSRLIATNIVSPPPVSTRAWLNRDQARVRGLEAHWQWRPEPGNRLVLSYAYADVDSATPSLEDSTPRHTLSALGIMRFSPKWSGSATFYHVGDQKWLDQAAGSEVIPSHNRLDLRLAYDFHSSAYQGDIAAVLQNALGEYRDFQYNGVDPKRRNVFDTRAYLTLNLDIP